MSSAMHNCARSSHKLTCCDAFQPVIPSNICAIRTPGPLRFVINVHTRWNSAFQMIKQIIQLRVPIIAVYVTNLSPTKHQTRLVQTSKKTFRKHFEDILEPLSEAQICCRRRALPDTRLCARVIANSYDIFGTRGKKFPLCKRSDGVKFKTAAL